MHVNNGKTQIRGLSMSLSLLSNLQILDPDLNLKLMTLIISWHDRILPAVNLSRKSVPNLLLNVACRQTNQMKISLTDRFSFSTNPLDINNSRVS